MCVGVFLCSPGYLGTYVGSQASFILVDLPGLASRVLRSQVFLTAPSFLRAVLASGTL